MKNLHDLRQEYGDRALLEHQIEQCPFAQVNNWLEEASDLADYQAMILSTAGADCRPSSRVVLLKCIADRGFEWFTDQRSRKGQQLLENQYASLLFYWPPLHRQIRVEGKVSKLSAEAADQYFETRPRESRLSAAASKQSHSIDSRETLIHTVDQLRQQYSDTAVPRPQRWGGYRLNPDYFEFWQGRDGRLHDRITYSLTNNDQWTLGRLQP